MKSNKSFNLSKYSKALNKQFGLQEKEKSSIMKTLKNEKLEMQVENRKSQDKVCENQGINEKLEDKIEGQKKEIDKLNKKLNDISETVKEKEKELININQEKEKFEKERKEKEKEHKRLEKQQREEWEKKRKEEEKKQAQLEKEMRAKEKEENKKRKQLEKEREREREKRKEREKYKSPPYGINNYGNTCYFNSVNQIFFNLPILQQIFLDSIINIILILHILPIFFS